MSAEDELEQIRIDVAEIRLLIATSADDTSLGMVLAAIGGLRKELFLYAVLLAAILWRVW